jgi:hypothetical protein
VNARDPSPPAHDPSTGITGGRRFVWHALAMLLAAALAWLVFAAYRQPDLILDIAGMRLC